MSNNINISNNIINKFINKNLKGNEENKEYEYIKNFKKQSLKERFNISDKILKKYSDRIPIIVDCKKGISIDKNKYIVPNDLNLGQFAFVLRKRISIAPSEAIFLFCNNLLVNNSQNLNDLYNKNKDEDGFLYIYVALENTFGNTLL